MNQTVDSSLENGAKNHQTGANPTRQSMSSRVATLVGFTGLVGIAAALHKPATWQLRVVDKQQWLQYEQFSHDTKCVKQGTSAEAYYSAANDDDPTLMHEEAKERKAARTRLCGIECEKCAVWRHG